jgi:hypothetical protein
MRGLIARSIILLARWQWSARNLDENFPLALCHSLTADGEDVKRLITLGWRGTPRSRMG